MKNFLGLTLNKVEKYVIFAVTFGNTLEWYDFYLYIFWSPILSQRFFNQDSTSANLFIIISFYAIGFIFRPLGGLFFGRLGDRIGRKKAFISSLFMMSISTFLMGFIPTYSEIGIFAPILLAVLRIVQTFPSGGELPGAFCYLYEAGHANKKFMTSFAGFGNQIGGVLAAVECYFLAKHFPVELFPNLAWRTSFIIGGLIGFCGVFLRYKLHETSSFQEIAAHHKLTRTSIWQVFQGNWGRILRGGAFGAMQTICYHFISVLFPIYFFNLSGMSSRQGLIATIILLTITTVPLPLYGLLAEKYNPARLAIASCLCMLILLYPLYAAINFPSQWYTMLVMGLIALCVSCLTAIWPYFISHLFPTRIRYTCVGLSFNIADGILGGLSSLVLLYFINIENNFNIFVLSAFIGCIITITSCFKIRLTQDDNSK
jgi:MHS family proline/betaine transporter-like MFS transporter